MDEKVEFIKSIPNSPALEKECESIQSIKIAFSGETNIQVEQNSNEAQNSQEKQSFLVATAGAIAILAIVGSIVLFVDFSQKIDFLNGELSKAKKFTSEEISRPFLEKTLKVLEQPVMIRLKMNGDCLDKHFQMRNLAQVQPKCSSSSTQKWRLANGALMADQSCMNCYKGKPNCTFHVDSCVKGTDRQRFVIRLNVYQLDVTQKKVFFTIHNQVYPKLCAGVFDHEFYNLVHLEKCTGTDSQLFYLDADYEYEFAKMYKLMSVRPD